MVIRRFILKIKRRENIFYNKLYIFLKNSLKISFPCIKIFHLPLYQFRYFILTFLRTIKGMLWDIPLFKARCIKSGKGLQLPNGIPLVIGSLVIEVGNNVTIMQTTLGASAIYDYPKLKIGDNTSIGYGSVISIAKEVDIRSNVLIGPHCIIMDNDDHPIDSTKRKNRELVNKENIKPVVIESGVWLGARVTILKGVTIGENSIVSANSVVTKSIPKNCIVSGFPARVTINNIDNYLGNIEKQN